jgi:hypothetical protein
MRINLFFHQLTHRSFYIVSNELAKRLERTGAGRQAFTHRY